MKRTILTTLAATALIAIPACKGGATAAGGKLIPEQATIMVGIDVAGLLKSRLYTDNKAIAESQAGYKEFVEAAKGCNLDPETAISSALVGTDAKDGVAVVLTGNGIGDEKNLNCVADKAKEKNGGKVPFTIADEGGKKVIKPEDGNGTGYIIDAGTIVIASQPWAAAVKDLVEGKGKAAVDGPHKDLFTRADQSRHIWFAGIAPEQLAGAAKSQGADVKDFSGSLDLSNGLGVKLAASLGSADQAASLKKKADETLPMAKMGLAVVGLPATVADTVKVEAKDALLSFEISLSSDDLKTLQEKAGGLLGGGLGGGGGMGGGAPSFDAPPPSEPPPADGAPAGDAPAGDAPAE